MINKNVLIVDDDTDFLEQMEMMFAAKGYETTTASGRTEAEQLLLGYKPEIAVIDLMMENDDDGFVLAYKLKKKYSDCIVIMVTNVTGETGLNFPKTDDSSGWINADAVISKPVRFEQIEEELNRLDRS